jgi:hypothetical protein
MTRLGRRWAARAASSLALLLTACIPGFAQSQNSSPVPLNIFKTISATGTQTSALQSTPWLTQYGTLLITWASITGSPATCTFQIKSADTNGNLQNNGSALSVTPSNGSTSQIFSPSSTLLSAPQLEVVYACGTYPSGGTLTLDFVPLVSIAVQPSGNYFNANLYASSTAVGLGGNTAANSLPVAEATNQGNPCFNPNSTPVTLTGASSGTSATQLIALSAGKQIFLCSVVLTAISGTTPKYTLEYGTGTNCATLAGTFVGPSASATAGNIFSYPNAFIVPASDELCYLMSGTTPVFDYAIIYVQQ